MLHQEYLLRKTAVLLVLVIASSLSAQAKGQLSEKASSAPIAAKSSGNSLEDSVHNTSTLDPSLRLAASHPTAPFNMPPTRGKRVDRLTGLGWTLAPGVREADSGGALCVWRCAVFEYEDGNYPSLVIHEAVPLPADQAIDQRIAMAKDMELLGQRDLDASDASKLIGSISLNPDRVIFRKTLIKRRSNLQNHIFVAVEKNGITVIGELYSYEGRKLSDQALEALFKTFSTLKIDAEALKNSIALKVESGGIIYANEPKFLGWWKADFVEVQSSVLKKLGTVLDDGAHYIPPLPQGTTIEGIFEHSAGSSIGNVVALKSSKLVFSKDGRFSTSVDAGILAGPASQGSSEKGEGAYEISGYNIAFRYDNGKTDQVKFFIYPTHTFWPNSDKPKGSFNYFNLGGTVYYRSDN